ncbi:hypothetical protein FPV67DRAFT_1783028 [Lyophyllum atratum]|nr:hypothetical protein FPV67DRAFT_1783028 [Lyophyllum atratum]
MNLPSFPFPMSDSLPPELIDSILSHLCGTPSIAECALVCHSWLPGARHHLLSPAKVLRLDQVEIVEFLHLIDSPRSTLSMLPFSTLHLTQNRAVIDWANPIPPDAYAWRKDTAIRDFLLRDLTFPSITSLFLEWLDWRTLSPMALASLHSNYKSLKELELRWIAFTSSELCDLIAALTALEKITIGEGAPFDSGPWTVNSVQIRHPSLCKLAFSDPPSWMIRFFTRAIGYTAGIVEISMDHFRSDILELFKACGELLEAAGTSLRALKLRAAPPPGLFDAASLAELLAFPRNTNLQEIELNMVNEITLRLFLQGLKLNAKPNLRQLKLGLIDRNDLKKWAENWVLADEALSTMSLKDPKLILELPSLRHGFGSWNYNPGDIITFDSPHHEESLNTLTKSFTPVLPLYPNVCSQLPKCPGFTP